MKTALLFLSLALALSPIAAVSQTPAPPVDAAVTRAREAIADLALLQSITPMKFTPAQIEKLLPGMREASATSAKLRVTDETVVKTMESELVKARDAALAGTAVPAEIEKKVTEASKASDERALVARRETVAKLLPILRETLSETQKEEIERQSVAFFGGKRVPREFAKEPAKAPRIAVIDLALTAYIERVLLFERTIPLFEKIRAAKPVE